MALPGVDEAKKRGAKILAITTGGRLAEEAKALRLPLITFGYHAQPRAALGYSLTLVMGALGKLGFVRATGIEKDIDASLADVAKLEERVHEGARTNDAKRMAI